MAEPWTGTLTTLEDVTIESWHETRLVVMSVAPRAPGEAFTLDLVGADESIRLRVKVLESVPLMRQGSLEHRLRLEVLDHVEGLESGIAADIAAPPSEGL